MADQAVADQALSIEAIARPLIAQCRRDIAAAWAQVESAREVLGRSRWLVERWTDLSRMGAAHGIERIDLSDRSEAARIGMFVGIEPEAGRRARRKRIGRSRPLPKSSAQHSSKTRLKPDPTLDFARARG
jgi:hypothetical protein